MSIRFVLSLCLCFAYVAPAVAEDPFAGTGSIPTATAPTSAASAPEAAKPAAVDTSKLLRCAKNYGNVTLEDRSFPVLYSFFSKVGMPSSSLAPITKHSSEQAGCFTLADKSVAGSKLILRVEMGPPTFASSVDRSAQGKVMALSAIPIAGMFLANKEIEKTKVNVFFSEASVVMTVVDPTTGQELFSVKGAAKIDDPSIATHK